MRFNANSMGWRMVGCQVCDNWGGLSGDSLRPFAMFQFMGVRKIAVQLCWFPSSSSRRYTQVVEARHSGMDCRNPVTGR